MAQIVVIQDNLTQLKKMTDQLIMSMLVHNKMLALENLYDKYSESLYGLMLHLTDNKILAEELFTAAFAGLADEQILLSFSQPLFPGIMRHAYRHALQHLEQSQSSLDQASHHRTGMMYFLCSRSSSLSDVAYILSITPDEAKKKLRADSIKLRGL